jgi:hypothetical protein
VNREADSERDDRKQSEQHEEKHPLTFLSGSLYGDTTALASSGIRGLTEDLLVSTTNHGGKTFAQFYGANASDANAFGKCVSMKASGKTPPTPSTSAAEHFTTTLTALNNSGVGGSGTLLLNNNKLKVNLSLTGLETGQSHEVALRGLSTGNATCPTSAHQLTEGLERTSWVCSNLRTRRQGPRIHGGCLTSRRSH